MPAVVIRFASRVEGAEELLGEPDILVKSSMVAGPPKTGVLLFRCFREPALFVAVFGVGVPLMHRLEEWVGSSST